VALSPGWSLPPDRGVGPPDLWQSWHGPKAVPIGYRMTDPTASQTARRPSVPGPRVLSAGSSKPRGAR